MPYLNDPYFSNPRDKRVYDITVSQLLSHEAGWTQRWGDQMFMPVLVAENMGVKPPADTRTIVRFALDKRLHFKPGSGKAYSNLGYAILGLVIEKVSGISYEEYCTTTVLEPIGIYDMTLAHNLKSEKAPFEVSYYTPSDVPPKPSIYGTGEMVPPSYGGNDIEALGGAGAWIATAPDLIRLMLAVDGLDSREDILSGQSIEFMTDNGNGFAPIGWKTTVYNGTWWRTGSFPGSAGVMKKQPDGFGWVVLFNTSAWNGPEIYTSINNMMYKVLAQVKRWPERDLFDYSLPVPLKNQSGRFIIITIMCFTVNVNLVKEEIEERYGVTFPGKYRYEPSYYYHAFGLPELPAICSGEPGSVRLLKWGLIPSWVRTEADAEEIRLKTFNARAESVESRPSFSSSFKTAEMHNPCKRFL